MREHGEQQFMNKFAAVNRRQELVGKILGTGEIHRFVIKKEENRRISSVRVRIEHVIGDIKRYRDHSRHYPFQLLRISGYGHGNVLRAA